MAITITTVKERTGVRQARPPLTSMVVRSFQINLKENQAFAWYMVSRCLMSIPAIALQTFALYYVMDVVGLSHPASVTANLLIVVGACLMVTAYVAGRASDRIGRKRLLVGAGIAGSLGLLLLFLSTTQLHLMLAGAVLGIANGGFVSVSWAFATDLLPRGEEAKYMGLANLALAAGSAISRLIGPLIDFFNARGPNLGYSVMLLACLVAYLGGTLVLMRIRGNQQPDSLGPAFSSRP
jgi:MFS family permease